MAADRLSPTERVRLRALLDRLNHADLAPSVMEHIVPIRALLKRRRIDEIDAFTLVAKTIGPAESGPTSSMRGDNEPTNQLEGFRPSRSAPISAVSGTRLRDYGAPVPGLPLR